jgi:hypothetical protein
MIAVFTSEGLMRVDGYKSSRSGNEREGDHNKSEDFSHAHISSSTAAAYHLPGRGHMITQLTFA